MKGWRAGGHAGRQFLWYDSPVAPSRCSPPAGTAGRCPRRHAPAERTSPVGAAGREGSATHPTQVSCGRRRGDMRQPKRHGGRSPLNKGLSAAAAHVTSKQLSWAWSGGMHFRDQAPTCESSLMGASLIPIHSASFAVWPNAAATLCCGRTRFRGKQKKVRLLPTCTGTSLGNAESGGRRFRA